MTAQGVAHTKTHSDTHTHCDKGGNIKPAAFKDHEISNKKFSLDYLTLVSSPLTPSFKFKLLQSICFYTVMNFY